MIAQLVSGWKPINVVHRAVAAWSSVFVQSSTLPETDTFSNGWLEYDPILWGSYLQGLAVSFRVVVVVVNGFEYVVRSNLVCWRLFNWPTSRKSWAGFCSRVQEKEPWLSTKTNISYALIQTRHVGVFPTLVGKSFVGRLYGAPNAFSSSQSLPGYLVCKKNRGCPAEESLGFCYSVQPYGCFQK